MPIFEWDDALLLGEPLIDQHHQHLVVLLNKTYDLNKEGASPDSMISVVNELADYAAFHFQWEESWMAEIGFPDVAAHKKEHDLLAAKVLRFQQQVCKREVDLSFDLLSFLVEWFVNHIMVSDGRCVEYAAEARASQVSVPAVTCLPRG